jgi:hypothetical protein
MASSMNAKTQGGLTMDNELGSIETEMKRGFLQLLVLSLLEKDTYGYAMARACRDMDYEIEENTLYPPPGKERPDPGQMGAQ